MKFVRNIAKVLVLKLAKRDLRLIEVNCGQSLKVISKRYKELAKINTDLSDFYLQSVNGFAKTKSQALRKLDWKKIFDDVCIQDSAKMLAFRIIYAIDAIDDKVSKSLIEFANNTLNTHYRYWITMDISKVTFALQNGFYDDYYNDRKNLLRKIASDLNIEEKKLCYTPKSGNRLCIVTYLLDESMSNSMQRVAVMFARGLQNKYDEVLVVCTDSFSVSTEEKKDFNSAFSRVLSGKNREKIVELFPENVNLFFSDEEIFDNRLRDVNNKIFIFQPSVIIDISDEYSPISYYYSQYFKTIYFPLRNCVSSSFYTKILGRNELMQKENIKFKCLKEDDIIEWMFPEYVPPKSAPMSRVDIGFGEKDFILIIIGNNELVQGDFADEVAHLLLTYKDFRLLLVGTAGSNYLHIKYENLFVENRIIEWGYEKNLSSLCALCNVLVRPNTTGSSGATAIAAQQGLPIAMTNFSCDPMRWLGLDYSNNLDYKDLCFDIEKMYLDDNYYNERKTKTLKCINNAIDQEAIWNELYHLIEKDRSIFCGN